MHLLGIPFEILMERITGIFARSFVELLYSVGLNQGRCTILP